jgi:hypothetical protein
VLVIPAHTIKRDADIPDAFWLAWIKECVHVVWLVHAPR